MAATVAVPVEVDVAQLNVIVEEAGLVDFLQRLNYLNRRAKKLAFAQVGSRRECAEVELQVRAVHQAGDQVEVIGVFDDLDMLNDAL